MNWKKLYLSPFADYWRRPTWQLGPFSRALIAVATIIVLATFLGWFANTGYPDTLRYIGAGFLGGIIFSGVLAWLVLDDE